MKGLMPYRFFAWWLLGQPCLFLERLVMKQCELGGKKSIFLGRAILRSLMLCIALGGGGGAWAYDCTAIRDGNWSSFLTWGNCGLLGTPGSGDTVTINGYTVTLDRSPSVTSLTVNNGTLRRSNNTSRNLTVNGLFTNNGSVIDGSNNGTFSITVGGALTNNGSATLWVDNLAVAGNVVNSGSLTVDSAMAVAGDLSVSGGAFDVGSLTFQRSGIQAAIFSSSSVSVVGNLTVNAGSTVSSDAWSAFQITGNLTNNGNLSLPNTTVTFRGSSIQSINGSNDSTVGFLVEDGAGITMSRNMTVSKLTLTRGDVSTGSNSLNVTGTYCSEGAVTGGSTLSHVVGNLRLKFPHYATTCIYPVGDGAVYAPISIEIPWFSNVAAMKDKTLTGKTVAGQHPQVSSSEINQFIDVNRYWVLGAAGDSFTTASIPSGGSYNATFRFVPSDILGGGQVSNFSANRYTNSAWITPVIPLSGHTSTTVSVAGMNAFGDYIVGQVGSGNPGQCPRPAFVPNGVTCYCDDFSGDAGSMTSKIFNAKWTVSSSGTRTYVPNFTTTMPRRLRLTDAQTYEATSATLSAIFPAVGNYISVEFRQYAYGGSGTGADGMAVILSDYKVPPYPGAFGGSLGYAQKGDSSVSDCTTTGGCPGFAGGWIGVGFDEYGGYSSSGEGRSGGPGTRANAVAVRGSYASANYKKGYPYLAGTAANTLTSGSLGYNYQVIIDAREYTASNKKALIQVNRDTCTTDFCGSNYANMLSSFDAYKPSGVTPATNQVEVPENWQISFTGSTGLFSNIHEISGLRVCAQKIVSPTGSDAANFNAIDEYMIGKDDVENNINVQALSARLYTKLVGRDFKLRIAALTANPVAINKNYGVKSVKVELLDNSDASEQAKACASKSKVIASKNLNFSSSDAGFKITDSAFNVPVAYQNVIVRMSDSKTTGCSTDSFSIRPWSFTSLAARQGMKDLDSVDGATVVPAPTRAPIFIAGSRFVLTAKAVDGANSVVASYAGKPSINTANIQDWVNWAAKKTYTQSFSCKELAAAVSGVVTGDCEYGDVGYFSLGTDALVDTTFTAVDNSSTRSDCVPDSSSNELIDGRYYGCNIGSTAQNWWGRFVPSHFKLVSASLTNRADLPTCGGSSFSYMGEPMSIALTLTAMNANDVATGNYQEVAYSRKGTPASPVALSPSERVNWARLAADAWLSATTGNMPNDSSLNLWAVDAPADPSSPAAPATKTTFPSGRISVKAGAYGSGTCSENNLTPDVAAPWCGGTAEFNASAIVNRLGGGQDGPFNALYFGVAPIDGDGVALKSDVLDLDTNLDGETERKRVGSVTSSRFGLLHLTTTYGSELLSLSVPLEVRYWNGTGFVLNKDDACTIPALAAANVAWTPEGVLLSPQIKPSTSQAGKGVITLPTPDKSKRSAFRICLDISADSTCKAGSGGAQASFGYLTGRWDGSASYDRDPSSRAVFGLSRGAHLYYRENY